MKNEKNLFTLPVIYICVIVFAVTLVVFESRQTYLFRWKAPVKSSLRIHKLHRGVTFNNTAAGDTQGGGGSGGVITKALPETPAPTHNTSTVEQDKTQLPLKKILVWTYGYGDKTRGYGEGQGAFTKTNCEVDACYLTGNRTLMPLKDFDAVIFHLRSMTPKKLPAVRSPHQRWVLWEIESASYVFQDLAVYNGLFNWTMTYRLDSDVQERYGGVYPSPSSSSSSSSSFRNYARGKTKMAAWFVSNCVSKSGRENVVTNMKRYMHVDVYGACGELKCTKWAEECYTLLDKHYKFYLSFENSLCKDYVTEKLFEILRHDVVPVVFGLANYTSIAPPHSFINVLDFPSVKHLVDYLKYLDANDTAYNEYFKWKDHYHARNGWPSFCELCRKLHQDHEPKVYTDIKDWFVTQGDCRQIEVPIQAPTALMVTGGVAHLRGYSSLLFIFLALFYSHYLFSLTKRFMYNFT